MIIKPIYLGPSAVVYVLNGHSNSNPMQILSYYC